MSNQCPEWAEDFYEDDLATFLSILETVYQGLDQSAMVGVVSDADLKRWHSDMFSRYAPIPYYAGHYRQNNEAYPCLAINVRVGNNLGVDFKNVQHNMNQLLSDYAADLQSLEKNWASLTPINRLQKYSLSLTKLIAIFIKIHPFLNGNGHISRLIWRWGLRRLNVQPQVRVHPRPVHPYGPIMGEAMQGNLGPLYNSILFYIISNPPK